MKNLRSHSIFFGLALAGIFILFIFTYLTLRPLNLDGNAKPAIERFYYFNRYLTIGNFIVYFILLFVANIMYIRQRYWDTFIWAALIFSAFTLIDWWWLGEKLFHYKKVTNLWMGESNPGSIFGIVVALFGLALAVGNYLLLKRLVKEKVQDLNKDVEQDLKDSIDKQDEM